MKNILLIFILINFAAQSQDLINPQHSFIQANNINTIFYNNGIYNFDRVTFPGGENGLIWPVSSTNRKTLGCTAGIWIAAKVGPQRELRAAGSLWNTHFTGGNIPIVGQIPPLSVCNDSSWKVYLVCLNDQTLLNGGIRTKVAGGRTYTFYYTSWANWPITKGASYVDVNNIPGYQPGWNSDRPGIGNSRSRPDEILFTVFMDYTNCTNNIHYSELSLPGGTPPLGVEIHQTAFAFSCPSLNNSIFVKWKIINKSSYNWDSVYITPFEESDIGDTFDDRSGCDTNRNIGFTYNCNNNDPIYGTNPPVLGCRMLQTPLRHTGNPSDTAKLPYDTLIGYKMIGMTGWYLIINGGDSCVSDPASATAAFNFMRGLNGCGQTIYNPITGLPTKYMYPGNVCTQTGWFDSICHQTRHMMNHGPITMNILDTQIITEAVIVGYGANNFQNVCLMQNYSDSALKYYYNDFRTCIPIGIEPISNEVPDGFMLYQNYPNPFNPVTSIRFQVADYRQVKIVIYDALGREIKILVNEQLQPGMYEIDWDGENYPSGVYFYQLTAPGFTQTNKMVLLK